MKKSNLFYAAVAIATFNFLTLQTFNCFAQAHKANTRKLRGTLNLSDEQYKDFQQHAKDMCSEWNRDI